jgi:hypothetical protein
MIISTTPRRTCAISAKKLQQLFVASEYGKLVEQNTGQGGGSATSVHMAKAKAAFIGEREDLQSQCDSCIARHVKNYNGNHNAMSHSLHSRAKLHGHTHTRNSPVTQDADRDWENENAPAGYSYMSRQLLFAAVLLGMVATYLVGSHVCECGTECAVLSAHSEKETVGTLRKKRSLAEQEHVGWTLGAPGDLGSVLDESAHQSFVRRTAAAAAVAKEAQEIDEKGSPYVV